jgi:opacity protein-like surface antigen
MSRTSYAAIAALAATLIAAAPARAGTSRVAVAPFAGPDVLASEARAVVVELVGNHHQLVPAAELEHARAFTESDGSEPNAALTVARLTGADAVVVGRVGFSGESYALSLSVLRVRTGESAGAVLVPLVDSEVTPAARDRIELLLGSLLSWVDPSGTPPGQTAAPSKPAVTGGVGERARVATIERPKPVAKAAAKKPKEKPFPITFQAAAGLTATARRLGFSQEAALAADASLSSNPSPGLRVDAEAATLGEPGVALGVSIERSIGADVKLGGSEGVELPLTQTMWSIGLRGRTRFRDRWVPTFGIGYSELTYDIGVRPPGLLVPNARYAFLDGNAGVKLELGAVSVLATGRYIHTLATTGITDQTSFGAASSRGLAGEGGVEFAVAEAILIRAGVRYLRFVFDFDGTGDLAVALDGDIDQDVVGAVDAYVGGYGQVVYRF